MTEKNGIVVSSGFEEYKIETFDGSLRLENKNDYVKMTIKDYNIIFLDDGFYIQGYMATPNANFYDYIALKCYIIDKFTECKQLGVVNG